MAPRRRKRADPQQFNLPVERIKSGDYTERSRALAHELLLAKWPDVHVTVQFTTERGGIVAGVDEAVAILRLCVEDWSALAVHAVYDGERVDAWDAVLTVEGAYAQFVEFETLCLGVLSRRTRLASNARVLVDTARAKPVIALPWRHDHFLVQPGDAIALQIGGVHGALGELRPSGRNSPQVAQLSHAMVSAAGGKTVVAARALAEHVPEDVQLLVPADYENDAVRTSLEVARALDGRVWAVRLDTPENLVDKSIIPQMGSFVPTGVNPALVWTVRNALDAEGYGDVRILVSGGMNAARIRSFEEEGVPVDAYGVGAALFEGRFPYTADIVLRDGKPQGRAGRALRENPKMERVK